MIPHHPNSPASPFTEGLRHRMRLAWRAGAAAGAAWYLATLGPGATASVTVTIPDDAVGDWEIGCFQDKGTHWSSGMHATLRITS